MRCDSDKYDSDEEIAREALEHEIDEYANQDGCWENVISEYNRLHGELGEEKFIVDRTLINGLLEGVLDTDDLHELNIAATIILIRWALGKPVIRKGERLPGHMYAEGGLGEDADQLLYDLIAHLPVGERAEDYIYADEVPSSTQTYRVAWERYERDSSWDGESGSGAGVVEIELPAFTTDVKKAVQNKVGTIVDNTIVLDSTD